MIIIQCVSSLRFFLEYWFFSIHHAEISKACQALTHVSSRNVSRGDRGGRTYVVGSAIAIRVEARFKNGLPPQLRAIHSDWLTMFKNFSCPILIGCRQPLSFGLNPSVFGSVLTLRNDNRQGISIGYKVLQCTKMEIGLACWFSAP